MTNVLFVCGQNKLRSPTAEQLFADHPGLNVASAGLKREAEERVSAEWVAWADVIFVMEKGHLRRLHAQFGRHLREQRVVCLGIPDVYGYMDPALVERLRATVPRHLGTVGGSVGE